MNNKVTAPFAVIVEKGIVCSIGRTNIVTPAPHPIQKGIRWFDDKKLLRKEACDGK